MEIFNFLLSASVDHIMTLPSWAFSSTKLYSDFCAFKCSLICSPSLWIPIPCVKLSDRGEFANSSGHEAPWRPGPAHWSLSSDPSLLTGPISLLQKNSRSSKWLWWQTKPHFKQDYCFNKKAFDEQGCFKMLSIPPSLLEVNKTISNHPCLWLLICFSVGVSFFHGEWEQEGKMKAMYWDRLARSLTWSTFENTWDDKTIFPLCADLHPICTTEIFTSEALLSIRTADEKAEIRNIHLPAPVTQHL